MDAAPEPSARALGAGAVVFAGLGGMLVLWAAVAGDGSGFGAVLPVGGTAVLLLAGALVAVALGRLAAPRVGRSGIALAAATVALVAWTGATVAWSIVPDRSWDVVNRGLAFAAFLGLGMLLAGVAGRGAARLAASLLALVTGIVLAWALLAKAVPSLDPGGDRVARLREPVGNWNALALLADLAVVLGLWLGTERGRRAVVQISGVLLVYAATLALLLTLSRAGVIAGAAVVALWLMLSRERLDGGLLLAAAAGPAVLVGAWAFTRPALVEDVALRSDREADGAVFGVLALVGAGLAVLLATLVQRRLGESARTRSGRLLVVLALVCVAGAAVALGVGVADAVSSGRSCAEVVNDPGRLGSLDPNNRWCWWNEAWDVYTGNAPEGAGAGSFEVARKRYRVDARNVLQPHSVPLQQLADGGIVALGLFLALVASAAWVCVCAVRRLDGDERAAAVALVAAPAAYLLHALVDYSWDFLAVTAPTLFALGVLAAAGRGRGAVVRRPWLAVGAALVALCVLASFSAPRIADRAVRASTRALDEGDFDRARDRALWGRFLNPLSVEPLYALARLEERRGVLRAAERRYVQAVELQPDNPETWYALGLFEFEARARMCAAYTFLNEAYTLDPAGSQWLKGGPLDVARDAVNAGACEPG
jgi:hypothetical protein